MRARILWSTATVGAVFLMTLPVAAQSAAVLVPVGPESSDARAQSLGDHRNLPGSPVDAADGLLPGEVQPPAEDAVPLPVASVADNLQATPPPAPPDDQVPPTPEPARAPRSSPRRSGDVEVRVPQPPTQSKWVNIRIEATVIESRGEQVTSKKVVSITLVDGENGSVRSSQQVPMQVGGPAGQPAFRSYNDAPLNMDARARLRDDGRIHLWVTLEYFGGALEPGKQQAEAGPVDQRIRETVTVVLESGKPLVVAQSADAVGDRRVALEVKATVLK
jgi:hypothetical protein